MAENKVVSTPVSEKEAELLKRTFSGNEYLLKVLRALFLGFPVSDEDKKLVKDTFVNDELKLALRKKTFPILNLTDTPIGQVADFWIGTEQNILGGSRELIAQVVESKQLVYELLTKAFKLLDNPFGEQPNIDVKLNLIADTYQVSLLARNLFIKTIETGLLFAKLTAEQNTVSSSVSKENKEKDSNQ